MESRRCKGMRDLLPGDMQQFRYIEDTFRRCCLKWGYREVRTPVLEYLHLFTATGTLTPGRLGKVYSFLDWDGWSGERVVLKPDGTIPIARLYLDNLSSTGEVRLFYVTEIFAFEQTGKENRERWQCGVEFLGGAAPMADVEILLLVREILNSLGIGNVELRLSHAGLAKALVRELGISPREEIKMLGRILDGDQQAWEEAKSRCPEQDGLLAFLVDFKGKSKGFWKKVEGLAAQASVEVKSRLGDFLDVVDLLDSLKCDYHIDFTALQGFEYYTGICFQLLSRGEKIAGGGRYDELLSLMGGESIPASGFAIYVDPVMKMLPPRGDECGENGVLLRGDRAVPGTVKVCFSLAQSLRSTGRSVELDFSGREMTGSYRWVISLSGSRFVVLDRKWRKKWDASSEVEVGGILGGAE